MSVALGEPVLVVDLQPLEHGQAQFFDGAVGVDPQELFFEGVNETLFPAHPLELARPQNDVVIEEAANHGVIRMARSTAYPSGLS
ncbi:MAG: hypothetical protein JWN44_7219 [Myxococcales bacterium]|nr:hypothetical protein [Myxococcales bacterium]